MGIIFDIQRMSVHDGPGIRTTVFMKGCPLRCKWCHNPEGESNKMQLSFTEDKCIGCKICQQNCPKNVHDFIGNKHFIQYQLCDVCGKCVKECPAEALSFFGRQLSAEEVMEEVAKDEIFFLKDGGVTFSGGEAFMQPQFLYDLLKKSKERGYHTCVDTCGYTQWENIERVLPYVDAFLYDIKAYSFSIHKEGTGVGNQIILDNLVRLSSIKKDIYIRIPLIKEYNATLEEVVYIADFLKNLNIKGVTLMPYHVLGKSKYNMIGEKNEEILTAPSSEEMQEYKELFRQRNIKII